MQTLREKPWFVPAFGVGLGLLLCAAFVIGDEPGQGLASLAVMVVYGALLLVFRRNEAVRILGSDVSPDERRAAIGRDAATFAGYVLLAAVLAMFLLEIARGEDGQPWSALGAISGASFVAATFWLSRTR